MLPDGLSHAASDEVRVLALARTWSAAAESTATLQGIHERVGRLGAPLTILCEDGAWTFHPDDDAGTRGDYSDRLAGDVEIAATLYAARTGGTAVFVLAEGRVVRVGSASMTLLASLDAASELLESWHQVAQPEEPDQSLATS